MKSKERELVMLFFHYKKRQGRIVCVFGVICV